jgi:hypothetical protein
MFQTMKCETGVFAMNTMAGDGVKGPLPNLTFAQFDLPVSIENPTSIRLFKLQHVFIEYQRAWERILNSQGRTERS